MFVSEKFVCVRKIWSHHASNKLLLTYIKFVIQYKEDTSYVFFFLSPRYLICPLFLSSRNGRCLHCSSTCWRRSRNSACYGNETFLWHRASPNGGEGDISHKSLDPVLNTHSSQWQRICRDSHISSGFSVVNSYNPLKLCNVITGLTLTLWECVVTLQKSSNITQLQLMQAQNAQGWGQF